MSSTTDLQRQLNVVRFLSVCEEFLQRDTTSSSSSSSNKGNVIIVTQLLLAEALATEQSLKKNPTTGNSQLSQISAVCNQLKEALQREKAAVAAATAAAVLAQQEEPVHSTLGNIERIAPLATIATRQGKTTIPGDVNAAAFAAANEDNNSIDNSNDTTSAARITQLLQQQKDISTQEIEEERKVQSVLTTELAEMTSLLKDATVQIHESVASQNITLDSLQQHAGDNMDELNSQKKKMNEREKVMKTSVMTSVGTIFWIILMFVVTYAIMRLFPKPRSL